MRTTLLKHSVGVASIVARVRVNSVSKTTNIAVKLSLPGAASEWVQQGKHELAFYQRIAPLMPQIESRLVGGTASSRSWELLFGDRSETHWCPPYGHVPSTASCLLAVRALARSHARWWNHETELEALGGPRWILSPTTEAERRESAIYEFVRSAGDGLAPSSIALLYTCARSQRSLLERQLRLPLTLGHGDAHWWNFLYPIRRRGHAMLVDWQTWEIAPGLNDLTRLLCLWWGPLRKRRWELKFLRAYHQTLTLNGVSDFSWQACVKAHRQFVLEMPFHPAIQWAEGSDYEIWRRTMRNALWSVRALGGLAPLAGIRSRR